VEIHGYVEEEIFDEILITMGFHDWSEEESVPLICHPRPRI
jgi:hypothetical protein